VDDHRDRRLMEVLDEAECRLLLSRAVIGRLAFTEDALPAIQPVHFTMHDGRVVIPTRVGSKVAAASKGAVVAFEVDEFDEQTRTGWNVTVVGPSQVVSAPAEVAALDRLGAVAWASSDESCYITIETTLVRGRRIVALPELTPTAPTSGYGCPSARRP
jgi:nitroimidazol reductase NimA-like FMN-containing flavoprotein (pyridoxamine 5'-phosphate oxidase superfamily)